MDLIYILQFGRHQLIFQLTSDAIKLCPSDLCQHYAKYLSVVKAFEAGGSRPFKRFQIVEVPLYSASKMTQMDTEKVIRALGDQESFGVSIHGSKQFDMDLFEVWRNKTLGILSAAYGVDSREVRRFEAADPPMLQDGDEVDHSRDNLRRMINVLLGLKESMEFKRDALQASRNEIPQNGTVNSRKVFVVHGRNDAMKWEVAQFLQKLGLDPIILHEQPNGGRTVIEKFVDYSDVAFAVVLLTGDDRGGLKDASYKTQEVRARQNVILELGFFLGKLGRQRVCALYETNVHIPSDYQGVLFVPLDPHSGWKLILPREMKAAGLAVDMNQSL